MAARAVWSRSAGAPAVTSCRARAPPVRAQALGSPQQDAEELRRVPRGSAATPVRVFTPVAEAASAASAAQAANQAAGSSRLVPGLDHAPVTMEQVSEPVAADMAICRQNLLNVVGERHPMLLAAANQIFSAGGKRLRPLIVLLVARATYPLTGLRCVLARLAGRQGMRSCLLHSAERMHSSQLTCLLPWPCCAATSPSGTGGWQRFQRCCTPPRWCMMTCLMSATFGEVRSDHWLGRRLAHPDHPPSHPASHPASQPTT